MPVEKLRVREVVVVEGKYDAAALAGVMDGFIIPTGGFSVFRDEEKASLLRTLGRARGLLVLTDNDRAGEQIRAYVEKIAAGCIVRHAYIPALRGKESRKATPSREGFLGVEGMAPGVLRAALQDALCRADIRAAQPREGRELTYTDLFEAGISGTAGSAARRRALMAKVGLPGRLSKKATLEALKSLYSYEEFMELANEKPTLFWDFHGTLTEPDLNWFAAAEHAAAHVAPGKPLTRDMLEQHLHGTCLPWFIVPDRDTRHLSGSGAWWASSEAEFVKMFIKCGFTEAEAEKMAPMMRPYVLDASHYTLWPDTMETLAELKKRGYKSYILSNNFPELDGIVRELGLMPYFDGVVVSGEVGYDKPRREIFDYARELAGGGPAVMIGDSPLDDTEGARQAGFTTVAAFRPADADYQISALGELLDIFE